MPSLTLKKITISLLMLSLAQNSLAVEHRTIKSTELIIDFSLLNNSDIGRQVLMENLETSIGVNNNASDAQRAKAISDNTIVALVGSMNNGLLVADALGPTMSNIYSANNSINQKDYSSKTFSPHFAELFSQVNALIQTDSSFAKNYLANGSLDGNPAHQAGGISLPENGIFNVYDEAYHPLEDNKNKVGNSRPVQVAPERVESFIADDFFGVTTDSATTILPTVQGNASFPSGHSAFGFASTLLFAQLVPERYQEFMLRGSEYGNSRVTLGVHYALDVIGARIMTTYTLAQILNNNPEYTNQDISGLFGNKIKTSDDFQQLMLNAQTNLRAMLEQGCNATIAKCSARDKADLPDTSTQDRADYLWRLTYGLSPTGATDLAPVVPEGAEVLITTRFPYLTADQRRDVLATTEIESGHALDNGSGWARLNLYDAAGGYGAFNGQVSVTMDASQGGISAYDVWSNDIAGSGNFEKAGSGTLELTGNNSFNGTTTVSGGALIVSGEHRYSDVTVEEGALLKGRGSVGSITAQPGAIIYASNNDSPLTAVGDMQLAPDSVYLVDVGLNGVSGQIESGGTATINDSQLKLNLTQNSYSLTRSLSGSLFNQEYTLLAANQINGQFAQDEQDYLFIQPVLNYSPTKVTMNIMRNSTAFADIAQTANQRAVARAVESLQTGHLVYDNLVLASNSGMVRRAYNQLSGQIHADISSSLLNDSRYLRDTVNQRLRQRTDGVDFAEVKQNGEGAWVKLLSGWGRTDNTDNASGFDTSTYGFLLGLDKMTEDNRAVFGLSTGYTRTSLDGNNHASADMNNYHLGVYGSYQIDNWRLKGGATYSWHKIDVSRSVEYGSQSAHLSPDYHAQSRQLFTELGYGLTVSQFNLEPFINLAYVNIQTKGFNEGNNSVALTANKQSDDILLSTQGFRLDTAWQMTPTINMSLKNELGWQHQYGSLDRNTTLRFNSSSSSFTVNSVAAARDGAILKTQLAIGMNNIEAVVGYSGFWSNNVYDNNLNLGINWQF